MDGRRWPTSTCTAWPRSPGRIPDLLADYVGPDTIAFVEWPAAGEQELDALGHVAARVRLEHGGGDERQIVIT